MRIIFANVRVITIAMTIGVVVASCSEGTQIAAPGFDNGYGRDSKKKQADDGDLVSDDDNYDDNGGLREDGIGKLASEGSVGAVAYPELDLRGAGSLSCKGKRYDTIGKYRVELSAETLALDFYEGKVVNAGSTVEDKANPKIAQSLGPTLFNRPSKEDRAKAVKDGFDWAAYAIYAGSVVKTKTGATFTFDKPLPVFPWPAKASRYDELAASPKTWTSTVTGGPDGTFTAAVTVSLISVDGDDATIKLVLNIPEDTDRHYYESFPMARDATFTINSKTLDVRRVAAVNWYRGDSQCEGRPEDITMNYNLCSKIVKGKTQTFDCP